MAIWEKILKANPASSDIGANPSSGEYLYTNGTGSTWVKPKIPVVMQWSSEIILGTQSNQSGNNRRRWTTHNRKYGPNNSIWDGYTYGANSPSTYYDTYNPGIIVPFDCEVRSYSVYGNLRWVSTTGLDGGTALFTLKKNRNAIDYDGTNETISLITVGTEQSFTMVENNLSGAKEEDFTTTNSITNGSVSQGDILIPYLCRDFNLDNSTERQFEAVTTIVFWKDIEIG